MNTNEEKDKLENEQDELSFLKWVVAIGNEKKTIFFSFVFTTTIAIAYSFLVTPTFTAKTSIITSSSQIQSQPASSTMAALATISNLTGIAAGGGAKSQEDVFVALLNSDTVMDGVIGKIKIEEFSNTRRLTDVRQALRNSVRFSIDKKSNIITIEVDNKDPLLAAKLANTFVDELALFLGRISFNAAQQRISFYERAIENTQNQLMLAKNTFRELKENSGVISFSGMTEGVYGQIANKELQISAMSHFSTKQNPDIQRLEAELSSLREKLFKSGQDFKNGMENKASQKIATDSYNEIKSLEMILGVLTSQFKTSVLEAYSSNSFVQQVEVAIPPERRKKPQRTLIVGFSAIIGLIIGIVIAIFRIKIKLILNDVKYRSIINDTKKSWLSVN